LKQADATGDDTVLGRFLGLLANDIDKRPAHLQPVDTGLVQRLQSLVVDSEVDFDTALPATAPSGSARGRP